MRRVLAIAFGVLAALVAIAFVGFRIWLARQPNETRLGIEAFGPLEFLGVLRDEFFPRPLDDFGRFGRRTYPGRGHSPWVLRLSLDGRPRMLAAALAPECWLAYSTQTAGLHQLWRGGIELAGPAYDGRHGREPMSQGVAWWRPATAETPWRVREGGTWQPASSIAWRGHGFAPKTGRLWLRFEVADAAGRRRTITEWPERASPTAGAHPVASSTVRGGALALPADGVGLERVFELAPGVGPAIALAIESQAVANETDGVLEGATLLALREGRTRLVQWFSSPGVSLVRAESVEGETTSFSQFDCETCHHVHERVVGPAWQEIAQRHAGQNVEAMAEQLARTIHDGTVGRWGDVPMPPHPDIPHARAVVLARAILETPIDLAAANAEAARLAGVAWPPAGVASTYASEVGPRPAVLHPALTSTAIAPSGFTPRVGGLAWLPDGRLAVATWDRDGAVDVVEGWDGPAGSQRIRRIAEGLHEPLGLAFADGALHVIQKQEVTRLVDQDGDGWTDEYRTLANDWTTTSNFHEFGFGLPLVGDHLYAGLSVCIMKGGKSCRSQTEDRGTVVRVSLATGEVERVATGLRTPNGLAAAPDGSILVTDNQGDWLPASKLVRLVPGGDYGWRKSGDRAEQERVSPPALWLPQNEVGNSPTQPVVLERGPYAGQILFGDVFNGGLKRAVLEEVGGQLQGAALHFSGGLRGPVNRLIAAPDGTLVAGEIGSGGNWGEYGRPWYGLEVLRFGDEAAFEPMRVSLRRGGFELELSRPLAREVVLDRARLRVEDWYYVATPEYGGPKYDPRRLEVARIGVSEDRRRIAIDVPGLAAGRVVHLRLDPAIRSERGEPLFSDEIWYTINALVDEEPPVAWPRIAPSPRDDDGMNRLSEAERAEGWELLFDGESFSGWKNYGASDDDVKGWVVRDGALEFTRTESFARLVLRHLNPFARPSLDLMTKARFSDFELVVDWKVEPGGNSGIFYLVPDESSRLGWTLAPEMQVLDDARHADGQKEKRRAGDLYDVVASGRRMTRPAGEWNHARIRVVGPRIEHWLNGEPVVAIERGTPAWDLAVAASKHAGTEGYAQAREGHVLLQDHGDAVWYRNLKIRRLQSGSTSPLPPKSLGKSLNLGSPSRTASTFSP